jgi:hypothetical protein
MPSFVAPPCVLPDISPARRELTRVDLGGWLISPRAGGPKDGPRPVARARAAGRTEGGDVERRHSTGRLA